MPHTDAPPTQRHTRVIEVPVTPAAYIFNGSHLHPDILADLNGIALYKQDAKAYNQAPDFILTDLLINTMAYDTATDLGHRLQVKAFYYHLINICRLVKRHTHRRRLEPLRLNFPVSREIAVHLLEISKIPGAGIGIVRAHAVALLDYVPAGLQPVCPDDLRVLVPLIERLLHTVAGLSCKK